MKIYQIIAREVLDSRKQPTINVLIRTNYGDFKTSAPSGKSIGKHEAKPYARGLRGDINFLNKLKLQEILCFRDLKKVERICKDKIGANSLFAIEASLLKALAKKNNKELWKFLLGNKSVKLPRPIGNAIGGGLHSKGVEGKKPDFQEFLFMPNSKTFQQCVEINNYAYNQVKKSIGGWKRNDEGAMETGATNKQALEIMNNVKNIIEEEFKEKILIGVDVAASSFYKNGEYNYKNPKQKLSRREQIEYIKNIINQFDVFYVEDPFNENDFSSFARLNKGKKLFVVADDLTATNPKRLVKAMKIKAIDGIIIKPNQIGSLITMKKVIEFAQKYGVKTIISHRSGETSDNTIADLAVGFGCDFIKTGIYGREREAKLNRLIDIENSFKKK